MLTGCAAGGPAMVAGKSDGQLVSSAFTRLALGDAVYHCRLPGDGTKTYPKCDDEIPMVVLLRDTPVNDVDCVTLLPYNELHIHTDGKKKVSLKWRLIGPDGYEFVGKGINIQKRNSGDPDPNTIYEENAAGPNRTLKWAVKKDAPSSVLKHDATVWKIGASKPCDPIDPLISNVD